ncbi:hypothetical protein ANN_02988 [Periplaneta americana]|uniref:Magnesium-dependent phosphatase 1 n=1 Tax=Periplaneta americana TaxID=6978 RepID=A0ABQ8TXU1_PERAM|nr:hypothetical protein ANN_02988 [Periplaneta americana]
MQQFVPHQIEEWKKPGLVVFDLDFTLWPFRVDKNARSPFNVSKKGNVIDTRGKVFKTFPEVPQLLATLSENGFNLAVASRIEDISGAYQLLQLFEITQYFHYKEIYPGTKTVHFKHLHVKTGLEYDRMIFFDDDKRNVRDISRLGVTVIQVPEGGLSFCVKMESDSDFNLNPGQTNNWSCNFSPKGKERQQFGYYLTKASGVLQPGAPLYRVTPPLDTCLDPHQHAIYKLLEALLVKQVPFFYSGSPEDL